MAQEASSDCFMVLSFPLHRAWIAHPRVINSVLNIYITATWKSCQMPNAAGTTRRLNRGRYFLEVALWWLEDTRDTSLNLKITTIEHNANVFPLLFAFILRLCCRGMHRNTRPSFFLRKNYSDASRENNFIEATLKFEVGGLERVVRERLAIVRGRGNRSQRNNRWRSRLRTPIASTTTTTATTTTAMHHCPGIKATWWRWRAGRNKAGAEVREPIKSHERDIQRNLWSTERMQGLRQANVGRSEGNNSGESRGSHK